MIKQIEGGKKPDIEMEDKMITHYDICSEYGHSDEFFDFLYDNTTFHTCDGEIEDIDGPKASFFEDDLIEGAKEMDYEFNEKELIKEGRERYNPYDDEMNEHLSNRYIDGHDYDPY